MKSIRCAIYTRKSSEEGLEQSFNSLDAQREACAAYILSQASEGWTEVKRTYDDGGISGGTLERPGLKALMTDIAAGEIDIIVVYKVDRLTRSLLDFAKLVEAFDKAGVSFVSVTQAFNTTTSMGRLTLNMLLSFAQFEREVTAERIRDKIAASKAKGMWMGGVPPLGYKPDGRSLAIVDEQAAIVREIYNRYLAIGNVRLLAQQLDRDGIHSPLCTTTTGKRFGGGPFSRGQLYLLLKCRTYLGEVQHKDAIYPGLHRPIIDRTLWDRAQAMLASNMQGQRSTARSRHPSLLAGLIEDEQGEPLIATHANKPAHGGVEGGKVRYRYYVSRGLQEQTTNDGLRIPAREIERAVGERLAQAFDDPLDLATLLAIPFDIHDLRVMDATAKELACRLRRIDTPLVQSMLRTVRVEKGRVVLTCSGLAIVEALGLDAHADLPAELRLVSDIRLTRSGRAMRLLHDSGAAVDDQQEMTLIRLVAQAHRYWRILRSEDIDITGLAARERVSDSWMTRVLRLAFLSPEVIAAIAKGRQRVGVDGRALVATGAIAPLWGAQRQSLLPDRASL
jgi:DNA invertase Pin-like site-specific DNA recombinase